ncbi:MAG: Aconitate hydratase A [Planctomycetes bacterium]|nr:Aconitate hydratase A [Planctomycetota bacterium]
MPKEVRPAELAASVYATLAEKHAAGRKLFGRPLTLAEKVLVAHLWDLSGTRSAPVRKKTTCDFRVDRVAMQDATAQMAILQFIQSGKKAVAVPSTVHCDHLILARKGAKDDMASATEVNREVYEFLRTAAAKYGMGFWKPGAGIIHQVVLENYAFPGCMLIGTDSHTPNAGGLGTVAIGVGGADAVDAMVGDAFQLLWPGVIGVKLVGKLSGWVAPKDVILKLMGILTVKGGTNSIVEFFGPGAETLSCTGKATICNMGAEHGATTSVFPWDASMKRYLEWTKRADVAKLAEDHAALLRADPEVYAEPQKFYDRVIEIDLSAMEPMVVGPHTPDLARGVSRMKMDAKENGYIEEITYGLIGSCTNSSYEDMDRAASVARQAVKHGLRVKVPLLVTPGSDKIDETIRRDGQMAVLEEIGATVLANACGPCIGQWKRDDAAAGRPNSIVNSYNRNFPRRNDGHAETASFITSPELVVAMALAGRLTFDPTKDELVAASGAKVKLAPPHGAELPEKGFEGGEGGYLAPADDPSQVSVAVSPTSERLQLLEKFAPWDGKDIEGLPVLVQAKGKCTTDHISPAGPWLKFRGHLDRISDNLLIAATNRFTGEAGRVLNVFTGGRDTPAAVARDYKKRGVGFVVIGDENYGEGSSREHAAMEPRYLGGRAVIARSFARIHETNLKKQGILPLVFTDPADYEKVQETTRVSVTGLASLAPGKDLRVVLAHSDGTKHEITCRHSMTAMQIEYFKAGSSVNLMGSKG